MNYPEDAYDPDRIQHIVEAAYGGNGVILYHEDSGEYDANCLELFETREKCERFVKIFMDVVDTVFPQDSSSSP